MRRWFVVLLILVFTVLVIFGGAVQLLFSVSSDSGEQSVLIYATAFGLTYALALGIVTAMQWFGVSPLDFLPEKTLRQRDPKRFLLTRSNDERVLRDKAKEARKNKEFDWALAFANALIHIKPASSDGYEIAAEVLLDVHQPEEAIEFGRKVIEIQPLDYHGYKILGEAYTELSNHSEARQYYEQAYKRVDDIGQIVLVSEMAKNYERLGMAKEAADKLEEYTRLSNNDRTITDLYSSTIERYRRIAGNSD